jgi:type II secretory pathway component PulF
MKETMKTKLCAVLIQAGNYLVRLQLYLVTILTLILSRVAWLIWACENNRVYYNMTKIACYMPKISTIFYRIGTYYFSRVNMRG